MTQAEFVGRPLMRGLLFRAAAVVLALIAGAAITEISLRAIYRDAGRRTLHGPGGQRFDHLTTPDGRRGRFDVGARRPGVPRVMVLGDSITWGQGVHDWRHTWPELVASSLERARRPHEMAVLARPGWDIDKIVEQFEQWAPDVQPDTLIYQWFVNDIEVLAHRPVSVRWWQRQPWYGWLRDSSYLFFVLDAQLSILLPSQGRSYVEYILQDFGPGTIEWAEFERYFHRLAIQARDRVGSRILLLYPQLPYRGVYPLQPLHDRMRELARAHRMSIPPLAWQHLLPLKPRPDARWGIVIDVDDQTTGPVVTTSDYYLPPGANEVVVTLAVAKPGTVRASVGAVELLDPLTDQIVSSVSVHPLDEPGWQEVRCTLVVPDGRGGPYKLRMTTEIGSSFSLASIDLPEDYGFTVVDLTPDLSTFDTRASIFDAHPNEAAHRVVAARVVEELSKH